MNVDRPVSTRKPADTADSSMRDAGYAIVLVALLAVPLLTAVGLAVDVGSWYLRASRMQAAADAAALAGVVYQPDFGVARTHALDEAAANGFDHTDPNITVTVNDIAGERLQVVIHDPAVDMFFSQLVLDEMTLTRSAVAEYLTPIPLGSESNVLGNTGWPQNPGDPNFWIAVNGPYSKYESGDPFSTQCLGVPDPVPGNMAVGDTCTGSNPQYRTDGYWFAIDVPPSEVGNQINLWAFDIGFYERNNPITETGDHYKKFNPLTHLTTDIPYPLATEIVVHDQDGTPLDYKNNPVVCSSNDLLFEGEESAPAVGVFENQWAHVNAGCSFTATNPGIYPIQVIAHSNLGAGLAGDGTNAFSLGATLASCPNPMSACNHPRVYALGDMSLYFNSIGNSTFQLAEIKNDRAGENFIFRAFDLGDGNSGSQTFTITIVPPPGETLPSCDYKVWDETGASPVVVGSGTATDCEIVTNPANGAPYYNGLWLEIEIPIDPNYDCEDAPGNCWWSVDYDTGGEVRDFATFQIFSEQDPVHLVG